jgi:hypothetical protein
MYVCVVGVYVILCNSKKRGQDVIKVRARVFLGCTLVKTLTK